jgi:hypothetical protein
MRAVGVFAILALCVACGGDNGTGVNNSPSALTGKWHGTNSGTDLDLTLSENGGGAVHGTGQLSGFAGGIIVNADGSHSGTGFTITLSHTGFQSATYAGAMLADTLLAGSINGSGFVNFNETLYRQ